MREKVIVKTATTDLQGELHVGEDGLPELSINCWAIAGGHPEYYRPWTMPAAWEVNFVGEPGPLMEAWMLIETAQATISSAQREAEAEKAQHA